MPTATLMDGQPRQTRGLRMPSVLPPDWWQSKAEFLEAAIDRSIARLDREIARREAAARRDALHNRTRPDGTTTWAERRRKAAATTRNSPNR